MSYDISPDLFLESHEKNIKRTMLRMKRYLADPSDESIHDLRTAVRRLDASYTVLPKKLRTDSANKKFVTMYKKFFKVSSMVRDLDVMMARLAKFKTYPAVAGLLERMREERSVHLAEGERMAAVLEYLPEPIILPESIPANKLQRRFNDLITPLHDDIIALLPIVTGDRRRIDELHRLRIRCKKMRYLLELVQYNIPRELLKTLQKMQDLLGTIHDCDVMIAFLKNSRQEQDILRVVSAERQRRQRSYQKFVVFAEGLART